MAGYGPADAPVSHLAAAGPTAKQQSELCEPPLLTLHRVPENPINELIAVNANSWTADDGS